MTYNLFISHSWTYSNQYDSLVALLNAAQYFSYRNYSIPKDDPIHTSGSDSQLYQAIKNQMSTCHVVLILAGVYSSYSKWINKEVQIARKEFFTPKPIVAISPWGAERISTFVSNNADSIVKWNTTSIIQAIRDSVK